MAKPLGVVLNFYADSKDAVRDIRKLTRSLDGVGDKARATGQKMKKGLAIGAAAVGTAAVAAGVALVDMAAGAAEDAAAATRLAGALKRSGKATDEQVAATEDWISAQLTAKGFTDSELRPALGRLVRSTEDVQKAQELAGLAMDIAASTGKPLATVADALAKAYDGNTGALARMGIKLGQGKTGWEELAASVDGSAEEQAASVEGSWKIIQGLWDEAKESIGYKLLEPAQEFADYLKTPAGEKWLADLTQDVENFATELGELIDWMGSPQGFQGFWQQLGDEMFGPGSVWDNLRQIIDLVNRANDSVTEFLTGKGSPGGQYGVSNPGQSTFGPLPKSAPTSAGKNARTRQGDINVYVQQSKQEKAIDSAAMAIRLARTVGY